jgi:hypothetical protein
MAKATKGAVPKMENPPKPPATRPGVTKTEGTITEQGVVIQKILIRPVQRTMLDIETWRNYHKAAEAINGTRRALYDLYSDVLLDGFLKRLVAKRVLGVTKNKIRYVDVDGKDVDAAKDFINLRQFRKLRQYIQLQKAWGISVVELINDAGVFRAFDVPKKHIRPAEGLITYEQLGQDGIYYRDPPYNKTVLEVGEYDNLGYLLEACAYAIYKRGDIADWANYAQIFGMPFREARYDGFNEQVRLQLENALEKAGSAAYAVLPREAELTFHEMSGTAGSNTLYDSLRRAMNEEMTVLIIGATETTTSSKSSGYAQSETHKQTVDELADDDKQDELSILNEQVLNILINLGFLPAGGKFIYDEPIDMDDAKAKVDLGLKLIAGGVPVGDDWFYLVTGIPKPDDYDEQKAKMQADEDAKTAAAVEGTQPKAGGKPAAKTTPKKLTADQKVLWEKLQAIVSEFFDPAP